MGTFADDLRENRRGRFFLPYQEGWCHGYWSHYVTRCGGEQTLDDRDKQIVDLGYEIGIRCQRIWEDIRLQEQAGPLAAMCCALIAHINSQLVKQEIATARSITPEALIAKVNAQFAKQKKQHAAEARPIPNVQEIDVEHLTDIISDYIFSRSRAGSNLSSALDLPSNNQEGEIERIGKRLLVHAQERAARSDSAADLDINWVCHTGAAAVSRSWRGCSVCFPGFVEVDPLIRSPPAFR